MPESRFSRYTTLPLPTGLGYEILKDLRQHGRTGLILYNAGTADIFLSESETFAAEYRRKLAPNDVINFSVGVPWNRLYAWADAAHELHVTEVLP